MLEHVFIGVLSVSGECGLSRNLGEVLCYCMVKTLYP